MQSALYEGTVRHRRFAPVAHTFEYPVTLAWLDLSEMDFFDSTGLHAIVESVRTAKSVGRRLKLSAELPSHARRLMEIVGLLPFIPIAPE
jgi:anti-anti-sigma factor